MLNYINLQDTAVENQYRGAGYAFLVVENGVPTKLIYENSECPAIDKELSGDEIFQLFDEHSIDFNKLERNKGKIFRGMCSCYQFVLPEIFIDTTEEECIK
ncbi:hypothetical protein [Halalkalibacter urbisdiaboli]|uniref:hypothetical protein n=1 Tax=Halalkalibacter urbisdiaboli TaxID=1960589 RepID=UPI000B446377|nr:hypothetical protein [Halalkalibacter urbisdiaboli]